MAASADIGALPTTTSATVSGGTLPASITSVRVGVDGKNKKQKNIEMIVYEKPRESRRSDTHSETLNPKHNFLSATLHRTQSVTKYEAIQEECKKFQMIKTR